MAINADATLTGNGFTIAPNELNQYYSYTYNFRLSLYDQNLASKIRLPTASDNHVIIAESGVTSQFFIKRVYIESYAGATREGRATSPVNISIDIEEPLGFTLIDRLLQAANILGLPSLTQVPYVLELTFKGWDENGNLIKPIIGQTKMWVMNLVHVTPEVTKRGSLYNLTFIPINDQVQQQSRSTMPKLIEFNKGTTLKETLDNFANALTEACDISAEGNDQTPTGNKNDADRLRHSYKIQVQDGNTAVSKLSTWTMQQNTQQGGNQQTARSNPNLNVTEFKISVQPGTDLFETIIGILANTNEGYKLLCPAATNDQANLVGNQLTSFFHLDTATINDTYDSVSGSFSQIHTITVVPQFVTRNSSNTTQPGGAEAVNNLIDMNLLCKAYNYIFTGDNTEILDLNIDLHSLWSDAMPLYLTLLRDKDFSVYQSPSLSPAHAVSPAVLAASRSSTLQTSNQQSVFAMGAKRPDSIYTNSASNAFVTPVEGSLTMMPTFSAPKESSTISTSIEKYLEDLSPQALSLEVFSQKEPDRDYAQTETTVKGFSPVGNISSNAKLSIFGYLADLAYANVSKPNIAAMVNVTLIIRGDPFWLGISVQEVESLYNGDTYTNIAGKQNAYAVYQYGENNFYLKFSLPQQLDERTGLMKMGNGSSFNTLYSVIRVNHIFDNGVFKQELQGYINRSFSSQAVRSALDTKDTSTTTNVKTLSENIDYSNIVVSTSGNVSTSASNFQVSNVSNIASSRSSTLFF